MVLEPHPLNFHPFMALSVEVPGRSVKPQQEEGMSQKPSEECCKTQRVPKMRPENWPLDLAMERLFVTWTGAVLVWWRWGG